MADAIEPEVITSTTPPWKPSVVAAEKRAIETGDLVSLRGAVVANAGDDVPAEVVEGKVAEAVASVTISQCLKDEMVAPNAELTVGSNVVSNANAISKVLVKKALAGDMSAIREVLNRTEGKVPNVTHNSSASVKVTGDANSIAGLMAKIDKNKQN